MTITQDPIRSARVAMRSTALSNEPLAEIGRIVANFAVLEVYLLVLIHGLLNLPASVARLVTTEQPFRSLVGMAANLVRARLDSSAQADFRSVLALVCAAEQRRNQIVHSLWGGGSEYEVVRTKYTAKDSKGLLVQRERLTVAELHQVGYQVAEATFELERFTNRQGIDTSLSCL